MLKPSPVCAHTEPHWVTYLSQTSLTHLGAPSVIHAFNTHPHFFQNALGALEYHLKGASATPGTSTLPLAQECEFEQMTIEYLYIISEGKAEMDLVKVKGVIHWTTPRNYKEVCTGLYQVYQLLQEIHPRLLSPCLAPLWPHQGDSLEIGKEGAGCLWKTQNAHHLHSHPDVSGGLPDGLSRSGFFGLCHQCHHLPTVPRRWKMASNCILLQNSKSSGIELRDPQQGDAGHYTYGHSKSGCQGMTHFQSSWDSWVTLRFLDSHEPTSLS